LVAPTTLKKRVILLLLISRLNKKILFLLLFPQQNFPFILSLKLYKKGKKERKCAREGGKKKSFSLLKYLKVVTKAKLGKKIFFQLF